MKRLCIAGFGLALLTAPTSGLAQDASITFEVTDLRFGGGSVRVDVCTAETFLTGSCPYSGSSVAVKGVNTVVVEDVPPGIYAAQIYHDWNDNKRVDRGAFGIPREGIAFSNNAPLGLHGPSFTRAAFTHTVAPQTLVVKLRHFSPPPRQP